MKKSNLKLPHWITKSIHHGEEEDDICSIIVNMGVFYIIGVASFFVFVPFVKKYLFTEIVCAIIILVLVIALGFWLNSQVTLLYTLRCKALDKLKNAKNDEEIEKAKKILEDLDVQVPENVKH